jgi:hypothetical protein
MSWCQRCSTKSQRSRSRSAQLPPEKLREPIGSSRTHRSEDDNEVSSGCRLQSNRISIVIGKLFKNESVT